MAPVNFGFFIVFRHCMRWMKEIVLKETHGNILNILKELDSLYSQSLTLAGCIANFHPSADDNGRVVYTSEHQKIGFTT